MLDTANTASINFRSDASVVLTPDVLSTAGEGGAGANEEGSAGTIDADMTGSAFSADVSGSADITGSGLSAPRIIYGSQPSSGSTDTPIASNTLQTANMLRPRPTFGQMDISRTRSLPLRFTPIPFSAHAFLSEFNPILYFIFQTSL